MLRNALLYLSNQQRVFNFVRNNGLAKGIANRFVAGESLESAMAAVRGLNELGISASLDLLGESVHNEQEARATARTYVTMLDRISSEGVDSNVSIKLTSVGLDLSEDLCVSLMAEILRRARHHRTFVRIDMESSDYTERTLRLFEKKLYPEFRENVGIVLQSYLYRTMEDVANANMLGARVRLCKGAYKEPEAVAFPSKKDVDANYVQAMHLLMREGNYPGIATHDEEIIEEAKRFAGKNSISTERFEFQMLYGVRRDLQEKLVEEGYRMRVYVPFGTQWYPYLMRRLAERPANVAFLTGNVVREMMSGKRRRRARSPRS